MALGSLRWVGLSYPLERRYWSTSSYQPEPIKHIITSSLPLPPTTTLSPSPQPSTSHYSPKNHPQRINPFHPPSSLYWTRHIPYQRLRDHPSHIGPLTPNSSERYTICLTPIYELSLSHRDHLNQRDSRGLTSQNRSSVFISFGKRNLIIPFEYWDLSHTWGDLATLEPDLKTKSSQSNHNESSSQGMFSNLPLSSFPLVFFLYLGC